MNIVFHFCQYVHLNLTHWTKDTLTLLCFFLTKYKYLGSDTEDFPYHLTKSIDYVRRYVKVNYQ